MKKTDHAERGFHKVISEYDQFNNLIKMSYYNRFDQLVNRSDNQTAYIVMRYDENQQQIDRVSYNTDNQVVKN